MALDSLLGDSIISEEEANFILTARESDLKNIEKKLLNYLEVKLVPLQHNLVK